MIDIATGKTDVSDHALRRMKKECVVELFRETESKLHGATAGHNMFESATLTEIQELNDKIDDFLIQEAMNQKTIQELNESNKKLVESNKKLNETFKLGSECAEDVHNSFYEKIQCLEKEKEELIEECKNKNETNEKLEEDLVQCKAQMEENYKHHYDQLEPVLLENEKLKKENKRFRSKMMGFQKLLMNTNEEFESILRQHPNPNVMLPIVQDWITDCCEEIENDTSGVSPIAPTELDNLYCDFKEWAQKEDLLAPKRNIFKENLKIWQANSRFGLHIGEKKSDAGVNGYEARPRFNLKVF